MSQSTPQNCAFAPEMNLACTLVLFKVETGGHMAIQEYTLPHDLKVFGIHVQTFPKGISEAFDALMMMMPPGDIRSYFGISEFSPEGGILYYAAAEEKFEGEARNYGHDIYIVKEGEYLSVTVKNWRKKIESIKDVFDAILNDDRIDKTNPCIEWYKNEDEMLCMVKLNKWKMAKVNANGNKSGKLDKPTATGI